MLDLKSVYILARFLTANFDQRWLWYDFKDFETGNFDNSVLHWARPDEAVYT